MEGINEIRLVGPMIASLYEHALVQEVDRAPAEEKLKFLGNNDKHILILVSDATHTFLPENELTFLTKMLAACQLNIGDVAIVNTGNAPAPLAELITALGPEKVIDFGTQPADAVEKNQKIDVIVSAPIRQMMSDTPESKQLKSRLWVALKEMFGL
jgi:hypothetical protein